MQIISIFNFKGGNLKTTSCQNIGANLAMKGFRVLLIDMDAQHNLSQVFNIEPNKSVYECLSKKETLQPIKIKDNLYIAANDLEMIKMEMELSNVMREREYVLFNSLEPLKNDFDFVLIDCPPSLGLVTINALLAGGDDTKILTPVETEFLGLKGFAVLNDALKNVGLKIWGSFAAKLDRRKIIHQNVFDTLKTNYPKMVFNTAIRTNVAAVEAQALGKDIFEYAPKSNSAIDYENLTNEILNRLNIEK